MANELGIKSYDYVEFYVGSAKMVAYWYVKAFGMDIVGYKGPETGVRDRVSYYLTQNSLKFVITSILEPSTYEVSSFVTTHGDGVKRWAVRVNSVREAFDKAVKNGGIPITLPRKLEDDQGYVEEASIRIYDDAEVVFTNYDNYKGVFKPGFRAYEQKFKIHRENPNLMAIDHIVGNVRSNEMNRWADYFNRTMGFETMLYFGPGDISTQYSALLSKVVRTPDFTIRNPINEPYEGLKISQIEEYINEYYGSGIQHVAITCNDIIHTIGALRENGVEFLEIPDNYYDSLEKRNAELSDEQKVTEDIALLKKHGILCDLEGEGYLLQLFTKPTGDRPTFFFEIIQRRKGALGFGQGNFQSLFESIEQAQDERGNLDRKS
ncbi:MAG: 4-hydroxyphenylpyruvate dioxygenase [bacterium]|nr:4-hydroxyphenylpyruvate dioxygenase [bacterium]